jgi:hypothetical protein
LAGQIKLWLSRPGFSPDNAHAGRPEEAKPPSSWTMGLADASQYAKGFPILICITFLSPRDVYISILVSIVYIRSIIEIL